MEIKPVAWFKDGPYTDDEPLQCVFDDPHDEDCHSPLYSQSALAEVRRQTIEECATACKNTFKRKIFTAQDAGFVASIVGKCEAAIRALLN